MIMKDMLLLPLMMLVLMDLWTNRGLDIGGALNFHKTREGGSDLSGTSSALSSLVGGICLMSSTITANK